MAAATIQVPNRVCAYGSSELIPVINKRGEEATYKHGHNRIGKPPHIPILSLQKLKAIIGKAASY
jgi:hypothetical protein